MKNQKLFCVSNWTSYSIVKAFNHHDALSRVYNKTQYVKIEQSELTESTVTHAMSCEYSDLLSIFFNNCDNDADRVLLMNELISTCHYQTK